jgi:hypothetical protein
LQKQNAYAKVQIGFQKAKTPKKPKSKNHLQTIAPGFVVHRNM